MLMGGFHGGMPGTSLTTQMLSERVEGTYFTLRLPSGQKVEGLGIELDWPMRPGSQVDLGPVKPQDLSGQVYILRGDAPGRLCRGYLDSP